VLVRVISWIARFRKHSLRSTKSHEPDTNASLINKPELVRISAVDGISSMGYPVDNLEDLDNTQYQQHDHGTQDPEPDQSTESVVAFVS